MIYRALIHVAGPSGSGKTTLIGRLLERELALATCVRGERVANARRERESAPKSDPELRRYRESGASSVALYRFPAADTVAFYETEVMSDYAEAVFIEGDCPVEFVDLSIFVAPAPRRGESLLRRVVRDHAAEHRTWIEHHAAAFDNRESLARYLAQGMGERLAAFALGRPEMMDEILETMRRAVEDARLGRPPAPTEHWALGERYAGLERAQLAVVNRRPEDDPQRAEELCAEIPRLRKDPAIFADVLGRGGSRVPITAVVANLGDPRDSGLRKCMNRIERTLRAASE